ncbi:hypothetical protein KIW84_050320 [Lathyrus oleraceus]|uniref:TF-B3 domain-containing protein n=1 Tax=Pisum sativum TaxID=3888 RepID=A0A9D4WH49_PEA|nr:hypothetical protein KIW84_050320 [Pisum sativum]
MEIIRGMVSEIGECSVKRKKCASKYRTGNIPVIKTANITQVTNVVAAVNQPTNNGKAVIQHIKEEAIDTANVIRFMKEKVTHVEKCIAKKKHVGKKKFVGKYMDKKGNAKTSAINVMHFPRTIAKTCLRTNQIEIKVVDVDENKIFKCRVHTSKSKNEPSTYEKYMSLGWYEFAKRKNLCDGDTLV